MKRALLPGTLLLTVALVLGCAGLEDLTGEDEVVHVNDGTPPPPDEPEEPAEEPEVEYVWVEETAPVSVELVVPADKKAQVAEIARARVERQARNMGYDKVRGVEVQGFDCGGDKCRGSAVGTATRRVKQRKQ